MASPGRALRSGETLDNDMPPLQVSSNGSYCDGIDQEDVHKRPSRSNPFQTDSGSTLHSWLIDRGDELWASINQGGKGFVGRSHGSPESFTLSES